MTDLSPMERAVRALGTTCSDAQCGACWHQGERVMRDLTRLRTSDSEAFAAVLAECAVGSASTPSTPLDVCGWRGPVPSVDAYAFLVELDKDGYRLVSEGHAVLGGRVVELEHAGYDQHGVMATSPTMCLHSSLHRLRGIEHPSLYRVKPERSTGEGGEDAS